MSFSDLLSKIPLTLTDRLGWCALHFLWQGAAIGAGLWLLLALCRRGTAELRHAFCGLALMAMAAAPVITWQRLPVLEGKAVKVVALPEAVPVKDLPESGELSALEELEPKALGGQASLAARRVGRVPFAEDQSVPHIAAAAPLGASETTPPPWWQRTLGMVWLAGAGLMGAWRFCGLWGTFRLIRRAERAVGDVMDRVARMAGRCGLRRVPEVRITGRLISPAVAGVLRPVLLLPAAAMAGLSPRELDFVLAHEFAHIRRQDFLLGLLQSLVEMLLFFHPVVWWASHRMSFEREQACDDAAMRVTGNRQAGASALARLAELQLQHTAAMAPAAGGGQILARVRRLLEPARSSQTTTRSGQILILLPALLTAAAVPLLLLTQRAESQTAAPSVSPPAPAPSSETPIPPAADPSAPSPALPDKSGGEPPNAPAPHAPAAQQPGADNAAASPSAGSENSTVPAMRGSITDRNGIVLAESTLQDQTATGGTGKVEIRNYPLGATASHVLGYVRLKETGSKDRKESSASRQQQELAIRTQLAKWKANLDSLSKLSGDQLIEAAFAYGIEDDTLKQFAVQWKKDRVEYVKLAISGFGPDHPRVKGLVSSIRREKEILLEAAENYKTSLSATIKNMEEALRSSRPSHQAATGKEQAANAALLNAIRKRELEVLKQSTGLKSELSGLLNLSGEKLANKVLSSGDADETIRKVATTWRSGQEEYARKSAAGFASNHPDMTRLAGEIQDQEAQLQEWAKQVQTELFRKIAELEKGISFLASQRRSMETLAAEPEAAALTGTAGIEKARNDSLQSAPVIDGKSQPAVALTLDARIQRISENALRDAHIGRGAAVVLDVTNGDVLAMASVPDFDPNGLVPGIPADIFKQWNAEPTSPLANRALSAFPPGSTFKLVTAMAAGAEGKWNRSWNCSGSVTYGGREFECWTVKQHFPPHGTLGLADALKNSCNCWFYQCGNATGIDRIEQVAKAFALGEKMEIGIDYEVNDFVPGQQWFAQQNQGPWTSSKTANVAIGQAEVKATPLQMAAVAAAVANGGKVWRQHLISKSLIYGVWQAPEPRLEHDLAAEGTPLEAFAAIRDGMWKTVNDKAGATGKAARSSIVTIAGKTGTAQKWRMVPDADGTTPDGGRVVDNHTWFIGFAPFDKPRYAFAIVVGNGKSGGTVCAPIAKRIMESVTLMNEGKLNVDLSPLAVAKGNFDPVEPVSYATDLPGQ